MNETLVELHPLRSQHQKSFYGKALILERNGEKILFSYGTPVAKRNENGRVSRLWSGWTSTTGKHIRAFVGMCKSEFCGLPVTPLEEPMRLFMEATPR